VAKVFCAHFAKPLIPKAVVKRLNHHRISARNCPDGREVIATASVTEKFRATHFAQNGRAVRLSTTGSFARSHARQALVGGLDRGVKKIVASICQETESVLSPGS
jgi:hypothetical protein